MKKALILKRFITIQNLGMQINISDNKNITDKCIIRSVNVRSNCQKGKIISNISVRRGRGSKRKTERQRKLQRTNASCVTHSDVLAL